MNEARAKVYGSEHREPLTIGKIGEMHKKTLAEHFAKPQEEQVEAEKAALGRLREAKHLGKDADTLDESEKLDTVRHEHDEEGRTFPLFARLLHRFLLATFMTGISILMLRTRAEPF